MGFCSELNICLNVLACFCSIRNVVKCFPIFWNVMVFLRSVDELPFDELP